MFSFILPKIQRVATFLGHSCQSDIHEIREVFKSSEFVIRVIITLLEIFYIFPEFSRTMVMAPPCDVVSLYITIQTKTNMSAMDIQLY